MSKTKTTETVTDNAGAQAQLRRSERGAVSTEMAIMVSIVVAIALAVGAVMTAAAMGHVEAIPDAPAGDS